MPENIQHTLSNLEIPPPASAWEGISAQLNTDYDAVEIKLAQKLSAWEATPPPTAWATIAVALPVPASQKQPAKVITFPFRKVAIAAALTGLVCLAVWYYFTANGNLTGPQAVVPNTAATVPAAILPVPANPPAIAGIKITRSSAQRSAVTARYNRAVSSQVQTAAYIPENQTTAAVNLPYAGLNAVRTITRVPSPNVAAPPIRDANGNIILDTDLIRADNDNYIVVTGPNGEQTRISSKFLHVLSSLNADVEPHEYFDLMIRENNLWKIRFREWRSKIIQQASFIPTATNFLDILELKDMLQEN
jgi:hypothetical protein